MSLFRISRLPLLSTLPGDRRIPSPIVLFAARCCGVLLLASALAACTQGSGGQTPASTATPGAAPTATPNIPAISKADVTYTGHRGPVIGAAWSPDGTRIASCGNDGTVQVWNATTGSALWHTLIDAYAFAVAWSPNGRMVAGAGMSGTVSLLDGTTGQVKMTLGRQTGAIEGLAWSHDGRYVASGSQGGTVNVYDTQTGNVIVTYTGHTASVEHIAWSPDGTRIASASYDGTLQVWDAKTGQHRVTYSGHGAPVWEVAWSPDGTRIVSGTGAAGIHGPVTADNSIRVWDPATGQTLLTYTGSTAQAYALAWSPDGKRIASGGDDKLVRVWSATTGETALLYRGHSDIIFHVAWSPDGTRIASASVDGTVQIWRPGQA
jgi:WD40 repeat protein